MAENIYELADELVQALETALNATLPDSAVSLGELSRCWDILTDAKMERGFEGDAE